MKYTSKDSLKVGLFMILAFSQLSMTQLYAQALEVDGPIKFNNMVVDNTADNLLVRLADGTLAVRSVQTITDHQILSISNDTIFISNGGFVKLPADFDGRYSSLIGAPTHVSYFNNDSGYLSEEIDSSVTNEKISSASIDGDSLVIVEGTVRITTQVDSSNTNEIQDLSLSNDVLTITNNDQATPIDLSPYRNESGWIKSIDTTSVDHYVGIGTSNPSEKMEVTGAINIGANRDDSPESGTVRWNDSSQDFEVYAGTFWRSMTKEERLYENGTEIQKINAFDGSANDYFGTSVDIDGDYAIVGANLDDDGGTDAGSAYIYKRSGANWILQTKLNAKDTSSGDKFGARVAISGNYALIGANLDDHDDEQTSCVDCGAAYIFVRTGETWKQQAKLKANDPSENRFGLKVDLHGNYALIGVEEDNDKGTDSGSAYVFVRKDTSWSQQAKITAYDGLANDFFGNSVRISEKYACIGAHRDHHNGIADAGSVYVYERIDTIWKFRDKLTAEDAAANDLFGTSMSISGDHILIGAQQKTGDEGTNSGSAYIFERSDTLWIQQAKLTASDPNAQDKFGSSVSIMDNYAVISSPLNDDAGNDSGSAYIFKKSGTNWIQQAKLLPSDGAGEDRFGLSVSISRDHVIIGARLNDDNGSDSGSVYIY